MKNKTILNILSTALLIQAAILIYAFIYLEGTALKIVSLIFIIFFIIQYMRVYKNINTKNK